MTFDIDEIRRSFPQLETKMHNRPLVYLDNAATTLKHKNVINAINRHYSAESSNIHRGIHYLSQMATNKYEETRQTVQKFIHAKASHEVIFTKGTTDSINFVATVFSKVHLKKDDVILLSTMEHHSNIVPWQMAAKECGAIIKEIPINDRGEIILESYKKLLTENVKIVAITALSNTLGTINPIKEMIALAHENHAYVLVDAAQSVAHKKTDVTDLDCDFLVFSGHKMFGPTGTGVLYMKEELQSELPPYQGGGGMIHEVTIKKTTYAKGVEKFEAGTPHIAGIIALKEAVEFIENTGLDHISQREDELLKNCTEEILKIDGIKIIGTSEHKSSVLSFVLDGQHPHDLGMILDQMGVAIRTGHHCNRPLMKRFNVPATVRASFSFYNTTEDIHRLIEAIKKAKEMLE